LVDTIRHHRAAAERSGRTLTAWGRSGRVRLGQAQGHAQAHLWTPLRSTRHIRRCGEPLFHRPLRPASEKMGGWWVWTWQEI